MNNQETTNIQQSQDKLQTEAINWEPENRKVTINAKPNADSFLKFSNGVTQQFLISLLQQTGSLVFRNSRYNLLEATSTMDLIVECKSLKINTLLFSGNFIYNGITQWKLIVVETFEKSPENWNLKAVFSCGGVDMLGGYGVLSGGHAEEDGYYLSKKFSLLKHREVKIEFTVHFIDAWQGESIYLQIKFSDEYQYVWVEKYYLDRDSPQGINLCGNKLFKENKFSTPVSITLPHTDQELDIKIGSSLEEFDPTQVSWGISNIQIYIK